MYYHWYSYVRLFFPFMVRFDTPVPSFLVGGNHASTVGSSKNDMNVIPDLLNLFWTMTFSPRPHSFFPPFRKVQASSEVFLRNDVRGGSPTLRVNDCKARLIVWKQMASLDGR